MSFEECVEEDRAKKIPEDPLRAKSLLKSSEQAIETAKQIPLTQNTLKTVFRELYEGLRQYCEAIGYLKGFKFTDHESITHFIKDVLNEDKISREFDRYRKLRNGINYYGNDVREETVKEALSEVPKLINALKKI